MKVCTICKVEKEMLGIYGALSLYMNFINMFINLLMLFGDRK